MQAFGGALHGVGGGQRAAAAAVRGAEHRDFGAEGVRDAGDTADVLGHCIEGWRVAEQGGFGLEVEDCLQRTDRETGLFAVAAELREVRIGEVVPGGDPGWRHLDAFGAEGGEVVEDGGLGAGWPGQVGDADRTGAHAGGFVPTKRAIAFRTAARSIR